MNGRQNTVVCIFDPKSPRISAFEIHEWIYEQLHVPENAVTMVQIDGPRRQVYIKLLESQYLQLTKGQSEYKHANGEISQVRVEMAGMGTRWIRIANLPPEIPDGTIRLALKIR